MEMKMKMSGDKNEQTRRRKKKLAGRKIASFQLDQLDESRWSQIGSHSQHGQDMRPAMDAH